VTPAFTLEQAEQAIAIANAALREVGKVGDFLTYEKPDGDYGIGGWLATDDHARAAALALVSVAGPDCTMYCVAHGYSNEGHCITAGQMLSGVLRCSELAQDRLGVVAPGLEAPLVADAASPQAGVGEGGTQYPPAGVS
jgi:hypothetical protein